MQKLLIIVGAGLLLVAGCKTMPVAGECPEMANLHCMTRKICSPDRERGCQKCFCESPWGKDDIQQDDLQRGRSPDNKF